MKTHVKEPFLINPPKRLARRKTRRIAVRKFKRIKFSPKFKIKTRRTGLKFLPKKRVQSRVIVKDGNVSFSNPKKRKSVKRSATGQFLSKNPLSTLMLINKPKSQRRKTHMAKKKTHRLSAFGRAGALTLSGHSRLAPMSRGMFINPARRRRSIKRYRSNPALALPAGLGRLEIPAINELAGGIAGFVAVKTVPTMLFPITWRTGYMKYVSEGITVVALTVIANKVMGRAVGKAVLMGGLIAIGSELAGSLLAKVGVPMNLYLTPEDMGYYYSPEGK